MGRVAFNLRYAPTALPSSFSGRHSLILACVSAVLESLHRLMWLTHVAGPSQNPSQTQDEEDVPRDPEELAAVHVSIKTFLKFLGAHVMGGTTIAGRSFR